MSSSNEYVPLTFAGFVLTWRVIPICARRWEMVW